MDTRKTKMNLNPRKTASILSVLFWIWTVDIFKTGYNKSLDSDDLFEPLEKDQSEFLGNELERQWFLELASKQKSKESPSLLKAIIRCFKREYICNGFLHMFNELILRLGSPILLGHLLKYFRESGQVTYYDALIYTGGICLTMILDTIIANHITFNNLHLGGRIRIAVCSILYRKALRLNMSALSDMTPGKIVNLIANDVNRFEHALVLIHYLWSAPVVAVIIGYFLYDEASHAGLFGFIVIFVVVSIQSYISRLTSKFRLQTAIKTDERVHLMNEVISGAQVIKVYAWEKRFCETVALARKLELRAVQKSSWIRGICMTFELFTTRAAVYSTLIGMMFLGQQISAEKAFVCAFFFNILSNMMSGMFIFAITEVSECVVAIKRLQNFLMFEEINQLKYYQELQLPYINNKNDNKKRHPYGNNINLDRLPSPVARLNDNINTERNTKNWAVKITNATITLDSENQKNILSNINTTIEHGKLYAIIGAVGSGKSSFISTILGEIELMVGNIEVTEQLSYAAQEAWIFKSTVKQNIIFNQPYNHERYKEVVKVCALLNDFEQLPRGDQTIVGEKGSSLSGGQKARISLARAVYRQVDLYILDDPLSAVDTLVCKHLFEKCLTEFLSRKTRILVTHHLQFIKNVDGIILLKDGFVQVFMNYVDLLTQYPEYSDSLVSNSMHKEKTTAAGNDSGISETNTTDSNSKNDKNFTEDNLFKTTSKGTIHGSIFIKYLRSGGSWYFISIVVFFFFFTQLLTSATDVFLSIIVKKRESEYLNSKFDNSSTRFLLSNNSINYISTNLDISASGDFYIYTSLIFSILTIGIIRIMLFYILCMHNSQSLHDKSFEGLLRTSMRFFNTNSSGRILNRFSKDMGTIDELLPRFLLNAVQIFLMMIGTSVIVCMVNPYFTILLLILIFIFYWIRRVYLKISENLKRLEAIMKSLVFTHLNTTLDGLTTIRAYNSQNTLTTEFDKLQDAHSAAWYIFISTSTVFSFSSDIFCTIFIIFITFSFLLFDFGISGAEIGLTMTTVIAITRRIQWGMRSSAEVLNQLISVERVLEYSLLPPENNNIKEKLMKKSYLTCSYAVQIPENWPTEGSIKFRQVYLHYDDQVPPVLKNLEFTIKSQEKIGIIGRTGAGKSSLISALFRLAEIDGIIDIDGINISSLSLEDLRRNISIIPQDPVLFSGTLRSNLDPFNEYEDSLLWSALDEVELKQIFIGLDGLESRVYNRGMNFSAGQRQLICLARAILRNNKILVLDEATANVDPHTDSLIQQTVRQKFSECTVLTIAHRLNTIIDSDRILVIDNGQMVEFDQPDILLRNESSYFSSFIKEHDHAMNKQLLHIAKDS